MKKPNGIRTSRGVSKIASHTLRDNRSGKNTKKLAGNVLGNRAKRS